jgi:hypothetical protein
VQVDGSFYAAGPAPLYSEVTARAYEAEIEVLGADGAVLRRHPRSRRKGHYEIPEVDRIYNPSRKTALLMGKAAKIGPNCREVAQQVFARLGRPGQKALYGLTNMVRHYTSVQIETACARVLQSGLVSYQTVKQIRERQSQNTMPAATYARFQAALPANPRRSNCSSGSNSYCAAGLHAPRPVRSDPRFSM